MTLSSCVVCGSDSGTLAGKKGDFDLHVCGCGGVYLSPSPQDDAVDPTWDPHPPSFYALGTEMKLRWLARHRERAGGTLVEVGCGDGYFLSSAQAFGYDVRAIEAHPGRARRVAEKLHVPVEAGLVEDTRLERGCADIVYHCDLLSHFPDPVLALRRMCELLRPGGVMFFEVGLLHDWSKFWFRRLPEQTVPRHRWFFNEAALRRLLERVGLHITAIKRFSLGPQVLFYQCCGPVVRGVRGVLRGLNRAPTPRDAVDRGGPTGGETALQAWGNHLLRFRVGAFMPSFGPQTCLVVARMQGTE